MTDQQQWGPHPTLDQALTKIIHEIQAGLDHGFFDFTVTCEIVSAGRRRLTLRAGMSHQFVIPPEECILPATPDTGAPTLQINDPRTIVSTTRTRLTPLGSEREVLDAHGERL
jgi:hypothetical protein